MDLRQFRYFVAVAEELHFTRAAARLNIGQPPLSLQIQGIERDLGVQLFKRNRRNVELTPAGKLFLQEARLALLQAERAVQTVTRAAKGEIGTIRLSFITSVPLVDVFTSAIRNFRLDYPDIHLELKSRSSVAIIDDVLQGRIDIGFTRPSISTILPKKLIAVPVYEDRLMVVLPVDHPLAQGAGPLPIHALKDEPFVLRPRGSGTGFYEQVFDICAEAGFSPHIVQEAVEATTTTGLIAAGIGVTIAPEALRRISVRGVVWRELSRANVTSRIYMIHNPENTDPIHQKFIQRLPSVPRQKL